MDEFIKVLKKINKEEVLNNLQHLIEEAVGLANELLVTESGACNWENHEILKKQGFLVYPGEQDRFGWLTGCIETKKGILVFG
jgi:hypothetical protein